MNGLSVLLNRRQARELAVIKLAKMDPAKISRIYELVQENKDRALEKRLDDYQKKAVWITSRQIGILYFYTEKHPSRFQEIISIWKWYNYEKRDLFIISMKLFDGDVKEFESFLSEFDDIPPIEGYLAYGSDTIIVSTPTIQKAIRSEKALSLEECRYILNGLQA